MSATSAHSGTPSNNTGVLKSGSRTLAESPTTDLTFSESSVAFYFPSASSSMTPALVFLVVRKTNPSSAKLIASDTFLITAANDPPSSGQLIVIATVLGIRRRSMAILPFVRLFFDIAVFSVEKVALFLRPLRMTWLQVSRCSFCCCCG